MTIEFEVNEQNEPPAEDPATAEPFPETASAAEPSAEAPNDEEEEPAAAEGEPAPAADRMILLVRHGIAEERGGEADDAERALTKEGAARMKQIGKSLAEIFPRAEAIYTSPLVRAAQTSVWISKGYRGKVDVRTTEALLPGKAEESAGEFLRSIPERYAVLVGHEPDLTRLLGACCGVNSAAMSLKKGGCYAIRIGSDGKGTLEWMLPPRVLRRVRG